MSAHGACLPLILPTVCVSAWCVRVHCLPEARSPVLGPDPGALRARCVAALVCYAGLVTHRWRSTTLLAAVYHITHGRVPHYSRSEYCRAPRAWQDPAVQVNDLVRCISGCILNLEIYITVGRSGQDPHTPGMFCTGCGSQLLGGDQFCTACGQAIPPSPAGWGGMQGEEHQLGAVPGRAHTCIDECNNEARND